MWLPWYYGFWLTLGCTFGFVTLGAPSVIRGGTGVAGRWVPPSVQAGRRGAFQSVLREAAVLSALYTAWRIVGRLSVIHPEGAFDRAEWLWDFERWLHLPNEAAWQGAILDHGWLVQAANIYYGGAHVPLMGVFLVWMFFRYRGEYPPWRNSLAASTIACVLVQLFPLAPPRLVPQFGLIDTPHLYGQSVYPESGASLSGQLQAMPSIHVAWAALIAWAVWSVDRGRARWLALAHFVLTCWVVVVTGNHYWLDGVVGVAILALCLVVAKRLSRADGVSRRESASG